MPKPVRKSKKWISLDTEVTGVDLKHGARVFIVTIYEETGENVWWIWDVNPYTREPFVPIQDLEEIQEYLDGADVIAMQNGGFDHEALKLAFERAGRTLRWDWSKVRDTLLAGHLLASNQPHNLTDMVVQYLGYDIEPLELALEEAVKAARSLCRRKDFKEKHSEFFLAKFGAPGMPSIKPSSQDNKGKAWKADYWLPRAVAIAEGYDEDHPWYNVATEYANGDTSSTLPLAKAMLKEIDRRNLTAIYNERLKILPIVAGMEDRGVSLSRARLDSLYEEFQEGSEKCNRVCVNIASSLGHELKLPKNGNNKSLTNFVFNGLKLETVKESKKTGAPSLDKFCIEHYQATLPAQSKGMFFINSLQAKRKQDTALSYMEGYRRFWIPAAVKGGDDEDLWYTLYPNLNPTGTDTLRWSSSNPNEQNISKQEGYNLRRSFGPLPGREWWSLDAKNIELRLPAYESGEQLLIDLFERPNDPPYYGSTHLLNFHTVYDDIWDKELKVVPIEKVGPHCKKKYAATWYQWCKNGGFAVQYGAVEREEGTADKAFHRVGSHAKLKARFSKLENLNQKCIDYAKKFGYVETIPDKTVDPSRGYPLLCTRNNWGEIKPTVPLNYHIQSTAMWWMMKAMIRCFSYLQEHNARCKPEDRIYMIMQVHDELVFDLPKRANPRTHPKQSNIKIIEDLRDLMAEGGNDLVIKIPTPVGAEYHKENWAEGDTIF